MDYGGSLVIANPPLVQSAFSEESSRILVSLDGAETVNETVVLAISESTTQGSPGNTTFQYKPPQNIILEKKILIRVTVVLTEGSNDAMPVTGSGLVPVSYPLNSAIESLEIDVNGATLSSNPKFYKPIWERLYPASTHQAYNSFTPTLRDNDFPLSRMVTCGVAGGPGSINGTYTAKRVGPFSSGNADASIDSRVDFYKTTANLGNGVPAVYTFTFTEPLLIDFFEMFEETGLINITTLTIKINWASDAFSRMFSNVSTATNVIGAGDRTNAGAIIRNFSCNFNAGAALILRQVTPSENISRRDHFTMPYQTVSRYATTAGGNMAAGASQTFTMNTIAPNTIPRYIILCVRVDPNSPATWNVAANGNVNCFLQINKVVISIDGSPAYLTNATPEQLYEISVRNGFTGSWEEWYRRGQGFFIAEFGKDIGGYVPGTNVSINIQPMITVTNQNAVALDVTRPDVVLGPLVFECFFVTDGFATITRDGLVTRMGLSRDEVAESLEGPVYEPEHLHELSARHGKGFGSVFRTVRNVLGSIAKPASGLLGMVPHPGAQVASQVLNGADRVLNGSGMHKSHHHKKHRSGGSRLMN